VVVRSGYAEEWYRPRWWAVTLNPVPLAFGRLSANLELDLAPHHALVLSPNVLFAGVGRGDPRTLLSDGFGFASTGSQSYGFEVGYHYWMRRRPALEGIFLGPSVVVGVTTQATVGDPSRTQAYGGAAFDVGYQAVVGPGFVVGAGAGAGLIHMSSTNALFPRLLFQIGWTL
jgi:hypothetical protein